MYFSVIIVKKLGIWVGIYDCMLWINQLFFLKNITEQTSSGIFFFLNRRRTWKILIPLKVTELLKTLDPEKS